MADMKKSTAGRALRAVRLVAGMLAVISLWSASASGFAAAEVWRVGTWKTAQTIQPFLYQKYAAPTNPGLQVEVRPFTNPADQKSASAQLDNVSLDIVFA